MGSHVKPGHAFVCSHERSRYKSVDARSQHKSATRIGFRDQVWRKTQNGLSVVRRLIAMQVKGRSRQQPQIAALSGSHSKAPGFAGGYLLLSAPRLV